MEDEIGALHRGEEVLVIEVVEEDPGVDREEEV